MRTIKLGHPNLHLHVNLKSNYNLYLKINVGIFCYINVTKYQGVLRNYKLPNATLIMAASDSHGRRRGRGGSELHIFLTDS